MHLVFLATVINISYFIMILLIPFPGRYQISSMRLLFVHRASLKVSTQRFAHKDQTYANVRFLISSVKNQIVSYEPLIIHQACRLNRFLGKIQFPGFKCSHTFKFLQYFIENLCQNMSGRRPNQDYFENDSDEFDDAPFIQDQIIEENVELSFDDLKLIELHKMHGNKWKKISTFYEDKDDSYIKNHFYSLLRRALRKLNSYIKSPHGLANKHKPLKLNFVFKLTNLAEFERNGISNTTSYGILLYQFLELKDEKVEKKTLTKNSGSQSYFPGFDNQEVEKLLKSLKDIEQFFLDHNLNKKGKSKKKCPKKIQLKKEAIRKSLNLMELEGESGYMKPSFSRLPSFDGLTSSDQNEGNRLRKESKGSWSEPFKSSEEDSDDKVCCMDDYAKTMLFPWSIEQPDGLSIIEVEYPNANLNISILDQDSSYDPVLFK